MEVGYNNAERLVRTELNYVQNRAALDSIQSAGLEYYQYIAALDRRTCPRCGGLDGRVIALEEAMQGDNYPPLHPSCRCTVTVALGEDLPVKRRSRIAERREKLDGSVTYKEWLGKYVEKDKGVVSGSVDSLPFKRINVFHTINEDLKAVNPNYKPNTEWSRNCQRCAPTYELRRRGYDVTAKPVNDIRKDFLSRGGNYAKVFENPQIIGCTGDVVKTICSYMMKWGNGSRAEVFIRKKGTNEAHIFVAENRLGEIVFIDPQRALENVEDYFEDAQEGYTFIFRMDDLKFTKFINDCCEEVKK